MKKAIATIVKVLIISVLILTSINSYAQENSLKLKVSDIKKEGGTILIAIGDYTNPLSMVSKMIKADGKNVEVTLYDIPEGKNNLYVFHDANGNFTLDMDENGTPLEGCYSGELEIGKGKKEMEIKLKYYDPAVSKK